MNDKGSLWGVGLIIVLVALGMWWLSANKAAPVDELEQLLNGLKEETSLAFSEIQPADFNWMTGSGEGTNQMSVSGKGFEVTGISSDQEQEIKDYFVAQGFTADINNAAAGTVSRLSGYTKEKVVVLVETNVTGGEEGMEAENVTYDVKVRCGTVETPITADDERLLAQAFAEKYSKDLEEVSVDITKMIDTFATGGVKLSSDAEAEGGLFFAVKQEGKWLIAWDGNGTIGCADINQYSFPTEIISECVDEQGNLQKR